MIKDIEDLIGQSRASATIPWRSRDLRRESPNAGRWRLMESPLFYLVSRRCLLDPAGNPFRMDMVYGDAGDCPEAYAERAVPGPDVWEGIPAMRPGRPEREMERFLASRLEPWEASPYLNTKHRRVENRLNRRFLRILLAGQLGERARIPGIAWFMRFADDSGNAWRLGLAASLFLCALGGEWRDKGFALIDAMNASMGGSGEFDPARIDIGDSAEFLGLFKWADDFLEDRELGRAMEIHGTWANPLMMALLRMARRHGALPAADFGWVRAFDRTLWLCLSQEGRMACAEGAGASCQMLCEERIGEPIDFPCVEPAVEGFERRMIAEGWLPQKEEGR